MEAYAVSNMLERFRIEDDVLEGVTGGTEGGINYGMDKDPLYNKFSDFWNGKEKKGVTGEGSRTEFIDNFRSWVKDGMPENISKWYNEKKT